MWGAVAEHGLHDGHVVFVLLDDLDLGRSANALTQAVLKCIAPGSCVIHDDWGAYRAVQWESLPFDHDSRCVVHHSKEIVNIFGEHTNTIESVWGVLKKWLRSRHGGKVPSDPETLEGELWEFVWRKKAPDGMCVAELVDLLHEKVLF